MSTQQIDQALADCFHRLGEAAKPAHDALVAATVRLCDAAGPVHAQLREAYVRLLYMQAANFADMLRQAREEREARR